MGDESESRNLPTSQQVEAELNRELGRRRVFVGLRCLFYVLITAAIVAFVLFVVMPGMV